MAEIDLKNGPVVVEIPGPVLGILDDAFFRYVSDIGLAGPDQGKGGKYLLIGPDYEGDIPEGYFVAKSTTYRHWLLMRVFVKDGDLEGVCQRAQRRLSLLSTCASRQSTKAKSRRPLRHKVQYDSCER